VDDHASGENGKEWQGPTSSKSVAQLWQGPTLHKKMPPPLISIMRKVGAA
jgi:hypothetical protein